MKAKETLASALRNKLTAITNLICFLEEEPSNKEWEKRFRESAIKSLEEAIEKLKNFPYKEEMDD